jgi:hypothetical protein
VITILVFQNGDPHFNMGTHAFQFGDPHFNMGILAYAIPVSKQ